MGKVEIWMRFTKRGKVATGGLERLRLIYPDGKAEWTDGIHLRISRNRYTTWDDLYPCWHRNFEVGKCYLKFKSLMTKKEAIEAMKEYDKEQGFKTIKIGEI